MKFIDVLADANRNLLRNKTRSILTILAVFVGSFTIILNAAINAGVNDFIDKQVESIGGDGYVEIMPSAMAEQYAAMITGGSKVQEYNPDRGTAEVVYITEDDLTKIRAVDGVKSVRTYHQPTAEYIASSQTDKKYKVSVNVVPSDSLQVDVVAGRTLDIDSAEPQIILTEDYVKELGFADNTAAVGQTVRLGVKNSLKCMTAALADCISTVDAKVVGVQAPGVMMNLGNLNVNPALSDKIYNLYTDGMAESSKERSYYAVGDVDPAKVSQVKQTLKDMGFDVTTIEDQVGMIRTFFNVILIVFNIFGVIALIAAAIGIVNTLFMSVQERTREIGLMKAMGMSNGKIFLSFSMEAIMLGFWGSVVGIIISMLIGYAGNALAHHTFLSDFPTFTLVSFQPLTMLIIIGIIMLIAFLAGTIPARKASKQNPIDALRYE